MNEAVSRQPGWTSVLARALAVARVAIANFQPQPRARPASDEKATLERALTRAEGTWGGYMAARPTQRITTAQSTRRN